MPLRFFLIIKMNNFEVKNIKGLMVNENGNVTSSKNKKILQGKNGYDYILINHRKLYIIELVYN